MKKSILILFYIVLIVSVGNQMVGAKNRMDNNNLRFDKFKENFVQKLWENNPGWASSVGYHKYDNVLAVSNQQSRAKELSFCQNYLDSLSNFNFEYLSVGNKTDYHLIENQLKYGIWNITELKAWMWDPSGYNVSNTFAEMLTNNYDKIENRLNNFYLKMASVPSYYEEAKENINNPSKEHTQLAIDQNLGGISVFEGDLEDALKKANLDINTKNKIRARAKETVIVIKEFTEWLKGLEVNNPRSFRLGKHLYEQKFAYEMQSNYTAEQVYKKALKRKDELHEEMYMLAKNLWPKYFNRLPIPENHNKTIKLMIERLSKNHAHRDLFQASIEHQLPELVKFINNKNLLFIDPSKPLVVRKEPAYMAGVAGASISSPGPYDKKGNTYYNVGSLASWSEEKAESYLREYNHYILQILNIHEAIPGHYTQLVYANNAPSIIKSILGNSAMIEGWAVYAERMMLENGYDGDLSANATEASPEMWLMYYKWHLRSVCNTILDYKVHTQNMSKEEALKLLIEEGFQQKAEAEGKWNRVAVTSVQLCCYFTGFTEIYDLRERIKKNLAEKFELRKFHEQFLSYGSSPVKYIRQMMLSDNNNLKPISKFVVKD